jgi:hypothetical protein
MHGFSKKNNIFEYFFYCDVVITEVYADFGSSVKQLNNGSKKKVGNT